MRTCNDMLRDFLFENEGSELVNLKLLRGDSPDVTKEDICKQLHGAFVQRVAGQARTTDMVPEASGAREIKLSELEQRL